MAIVMQKATQPAQIGELLVDVVVSREASYRSDVTEYPVETGFVISDHISRKAPTLTLEVVFTPTPVTWVDTIGTAGNRLAEVQAAIKDMYDKAEPVTIKLADAIWTNMVMTSAPLARTVQDGICYKMQLNFTQVRIVEQKTGEVSEDNAAEDTEGKAGETESDAGQAQTTDIGTGTTTQEGSTEAGADTAAVDKKASGKITTKQVLRAAAAAYVVVSALR